MKDDSYKIDFRLMKQHVGVDDIAYALGYRLDKAAGVGRYIELVAPGEADKIIVRNPKDKASQTYFRRDGSRGDVITFIRENIGKFNVMGRNDWERIGAVLQKFSNQPVITPDTEYVRQKEAPKEFDPDRYVTRPYDGSLSWLLKRRGLTADTAAAFAPHLTLIQDTANKAYSGFNLGFVYTEADAGKPCGYEIRGAKDYKSKAAGTNSTSAAWVADFTSNRPYLVDAVYFFESAYDAMAFYQANKARLDVERSAFVSLGGTFSDAQVVNVLARFPNGRPCECFDNDPAGRKYADRLSRLAGEADRKMSSWPAPDGFKDWNDCILGKSASPEITPSKYERDANLAARRKMM